MSPYGRDTLLPLVEMRVPLCCDSCEKKVRETLEDMSGVKEVVTDRDSNRVTVTGFVELLKALKRVKELKPKSDLHGDNTYINRASVPVVDTRSMLVPVETARYVTNPLIRTQYQNDYNRYAHDVGKVHYIAPSLMALVPVLRPLARVNSFGRMNRLPSFSRVERYDDRRHNALLPLDLQHDYYGIRRMPSLDRHRYHDSEYISMGNEYSPSIPKTRYVSLFSKRPADVYQKQVSFSKLPVTNPYYMKHIEYEDNY